VGLATAGLLAPEKGCDFRYWGAAALCSALPDVDALFLRWIPYDHPLGHRGLLHSPFFALLLAIPALLICWRMRSTFPAGAAGLYLLFAAVTASNGILDAFTDGGLGVAFFAPLSHRRFFFPLRPIPVAPLSLSGFLSPWGMRCLVAELLLLWSLAAAAFILRYGRSSYRLVAVVLLALSGIAAWIHFIRKAIPSGP
jgi:inner membrane protein